MRLAQALCFLAAGRAALFVPNLVPRPCAAGPAGRQNDIQIDAELNSESNGAIARSQLALEVEVLQFLYFHFLDFGNFGGVHQGCKASCDLRWRGPGWRGLLKK